MAMTITEKRDIQFRLRNYVSSFSSQKKAAQSLDGVSEATLISMLGQSEINWSHISEAMWRNVANQVGGYLKMNKLVETHNYTNLNIYFSIAKEEGATFAITGNAGFGKTYAAQRYAATNRKNNVYLLECAEYWNKKTFLQRLMMQLGRSYYGLIVNEMMETIVREIRRQEKPIIIMDEIDKLPDPVFKFFITLYNELNHFCGFIWLSTDAIKKRMIRGVERNLIGYQELYSRIGSNFISLTEATTDEVAEICKVNGIVDKQSIAIVCNEVKDLRGDLRRVDRHILKEKIKRIRKSIK